MADTYIDSTYVNGWLGTSTATALTSDTGASLTVILEACTSLIQSYLRNSGYATPSTTTDEVVKLATMGAVWESLCSRPEWGLKLPENWDRHPAKVAYVGIVNGDTTTTHSLTSRDAYGGWTFSDSSTTTTTGRVPRATRSQLAGY